MDSLFQVVVLNQTPDPERVIYQAMHQDYSPGFVTAEDRIPEKYGEAVVKHLLEGNRGHYGPLEHPQITFGVGHFPHTVMQQARTHRVGISFDVQSFRYTGQQISVLGKSLIEGSPAPHASDTVVPLEAKLETLFYLPETVKEGKAKTRQGFKPISPEAMDIILEQYRNQAIAYYRLVEECGLPYEDARNIIGYGIRQHFVVSFNCRSLMHFLDLRAKEDAQREIQQLCELIWPHFEAWCPHVAAWYYKNRWGKARLSP
ncbi:FAD-dependent thymidylate synthase [Synechococcus sp. Nb3U1]|uniref:FAD-dependent thymidylate synthase n=1 Tax=Synechococcus sp. Nb3U1 TaxID=1914529 RepID=UPI001F347AEA|nr:FAD-dependent thymidylate synthase [Synechococcus sp. Nb3U1]MCF2972332.1 FAD-dependent thymidylate synthase [Synechococcus sp. Nb3U1]